MARGEATAHLKDRADSAKRNERKSRDLDGCPDSQFTG